MSGVAAAEPGSRTLAGIPFRVAEPREAARWVCREAAEGSASFDVHLVNAYTVALSSHDDSYHELLVSAGANFPDGRPLATVTKTTNRPLQQVRGPALFEDVMDLGRERRIRHYLLGSTDETLGNLIEELERRFPGVQIAGSYSPPFRSLTPAELESQDAAIRASAADIVWVGLGTPKQDYEAQRVARATSTVAVAVGAAFDFVAGTKPEAPMFMRRVGLEWAFRLACEPRRLWKRYLVGNLQFAWAIARSRD